MGWCVFKVHHVAYYLGAFSIIVITMIKVFHHQNPFSPNNGVVIEGTIICSGINIDIYRAANKQSAFKRTSV